MPRRQIRVNIVLPDIAAESILIARLDTYAQRADDFLPLCTSEPLTEQNTDCYVVDVRDLNRLTDTPSPLRKPVIAYGQTELLRSAFAAGCADYMKDPWTPEELHFRALRFRRPTSQRFDWGTVVLQGQSLSISLNAGEQNKTIDLNARQASILDTLLAQRGSPVPRDALFLAMWGRDGGRSRALDMQIHLLRMHLDRVEPGLGERLISSAHGVGYVIR